MPDFLKDLTAKQRVAVFWVLSALSTTVILALFFFLFYKPQQEKLKAKKEELEQLKAQLAEARKTEKKIIEIKAEIEEKQKTLKKMELSLPTEEYVPTLLEQIENLSFRTNVQVASLSPGELQPAQPLPGLSTSGGDQAPPADSGEQQNAIQYQQMMIGIPFLGTYMNLLSFLQELANLPIVVVITNLSVSKTGSIASDGTPMLTANLPAVVYVLPSKDRGKHD